MEKLNLTDENCLHLTVRNIIAKYGHIDILINNAGVLAYKSLAEKSFEEIQGQIDTVLSGPIKLAKLCLPHLKESVVNIGSRLAFIGKKNLTVYATVKFGLRGFTESLGEEYPDLRVAAVHPGLTATSPDNAKGLSPEIVGDLVYKVATGHIKVRQGGDFKVYQYLENPVKRAIKKFLGRE